MGSGRNPGSTFSLPSRVVGQVYGEEKFVSPPRVKGEQGRILLLGCHGYMPKGSVLLMSRTGEIIIT